MIRAMTEADVSAVAAIEQRSFSSPWSAESFVSEVRDNGLASYVVAVDGDEVVGYAGMWVFLGEAHVTTIAVSEGVRGRGWGTRLLCELMRIAMVRGARRMSLEVRPSNEAAQALYRRHGFEPRGIRYRYYSDTGEDAVIMWNDDIWAVAREDRACARDG